MTNYLFVWNIKPWWIYCVVIPFLLLCYGCNFQNCPGTGCFEFRPWCYFFHSANQPMILKKLREKIKWGDQVYKDDGYAYQFIHFLNHRSLYNTFSPIVFVSSPYIVWKWKHLKNKNHRISLFFFSFCFWSLCQEKASNNTLFRGINHYIKIPSYIITITVRDW